MTPRDGTVDLLEGDQADRLNDVLDDRARGRAVDARSLDPGLTETVEVVAMLAGEQADGGVEARRADQLWFALVGRGVETEAPAPRRTDAALGLVAPTSGLSVGRPPALSPVRLLSAVAAVLLVAIVASHYADLPGGSSTSTAMAAPAPFATATHLTQPTRCVDETGVVTSDSPVGRRVTSLTMTPSSTSTVPACVGAAEDGARR